uniref:Uncharacterized protein n=1 Tax=Erpetoichthys calabaricus TaxID=27687 RepID=A0A8C4RFP5_ERPCA
MQETLLTQCRLLCSSPFLSCCWLVSVPSLWALGVVSLASTAGTSACLGSSFSVVSTAFGNGALSVEALGVAVPSSAGGASLFSLSATCFSSEVAELSLAFPEESVPAAGPPSSLLAVAGAASVLVAFSPSSVLVSALAAFCCGAASNGPSLFSTAGEEASFLSSLAAFASPLAAGPSSFFPSLSFFRIMCPRKLAWILVAALWALSSGLLPSCSIFWSASSFFSTYG